MDLKPIEKLQPFRHFCMSIGELPSSYMESMTYLELLMWLCKYLSETVIPTINNNAQAVEELQSLYLQLKQYVDDYFTNLDVQDEINNKLDEFAEDGTLERLIGDHIDVYMNDIKKSNNQAYITPTLVGTAERPTGFYVQSFCYGGGHLYVFFINYTTSAIKCRVYTGLSLSSYTEYDLTITGHANACCYYNDRIYMTNYNAKKQVNVLDKDDLSLIKTITLPVDCRAFAIEMTKNNNLICCMQEYNSGQLRYFQIDDNYRLQPLNMVNVNFMRSNRNATAFINFNNTPLLAFVRGDGASDYDKGNIISFYVANMHNYYNVVVDEAGYELQDITQIDTTNDVYIIDSNGKISTFNLTNVMPSTISSGLWGKTITDENSMIYCGDLNSVTDYTELDGQNDAKYKVCEKFVLPTDLDLILAEFKVNNKSVTNFSDSSPASASNGYPGHLRIPYYNVEKIGTDIYILDIMLLYQFSRVNNSNLSAGQHGEYNLSKTALNTCKVIKITNDGTVTYNAYTFNGLVSFINTNALGDLLKDVYPVYVQNMKPYTKGAYTVIDWFE